jgi:putative transposase
VTKVEARRRRSLNRLCGLLGRSRQAYYKLFRASEREAMRSDLIVREVARIRVDQKRIGARKLHMMLGDFMQRQGKVLGRDAFFDLLRDHGLLVRRRKRRKPRTTFSGFWMRRYPNLAKEFVPAAANQLWVSDITYIRVGEGFCYLSLITDAYSRKIVGWNLRRDLSARGCVAALKMAKRDNPNTRGLIHHSDRGLQYYSREYLKTLGKGVSVSMSERSDPLENAIAERVNGILKQELLEERFRNFTEALAAVEKAVMVYNFQRPHLSIEMLTPAEAHLETGRLRRFWKNYFSQRQTDKKEATDFCQAAAYASA